MKDEDEELQLNEVERERLLFILGQHAFTLPTKEWEELARSLEAFAQDVAARVYTHGKHRGMQDAFQMAQDREALLLTESSIAVDVPRSRRKPMPEWEA